MQIQYDDYEFKYPYEQQLSLKHRLATRIWRGITSQNIDYESCKCCNRKIGKQKLKLKYINNSTQYSFLGPGIPLYLKFHKYSIFILIIFTIIFGIYSLYSNIISNDCTQNNNCIVTIWNILSIINKINNLQYRIIQNYVLLGFVIICLIILHIIRYRLRNLEQKIDQLQVSPSDYSIILKRLPQNIDQDCIYDAIINKINIFNQEIKKDIKIQKIILSYDMREYFKYKKSIIRKFKQTKLNLKQDKNIHISSKQNNNQKFDFKKQLIEKTKKSGLFAIVVFENQNSKEFFIYRPNFWRRFLSFLFTAWTPLSDLQINGQKVSIQRAPEPDDIIWQNAYFTPSKRFLRKCYLNIISLIILVAGGVIQYGVDVFQTQATTVKQFFEIGILGSIIAFILDIVIEKFLHHFTQIEKMYTQTQFLDTMTFKSCVQQFLNSGIFVLFANILANLNNKQFQYGLAGTITQIMILNAIVPNLITLITKLTECVGGIKRSLCLKKKLKFYNQLQANKIYQLPKPQFPNQYSYILKTLWLTAFYAPLVPIVIPVSALGLLINYLIQKLLFSFKYSVSHKIGPSLSYSCIQGLQYIPFILSVGQFLVFIYLDKIYNANTPSQSYTIIYICLGISFINIILPMKQFNQFIEKKCCCKKDKIINKQNKQQNIHLLSYEQAQKRFEITYEMTNPMYEIKRIKRRDKIIQKHANNFLKMLSMKNQQNETNIEQKNENNGIMNIFSNMIGLKNNNNNIIENSSNKQQQNNTNKDNKQYKGQNNKRKQTQIQFSVIKMNIQNNNDKQETQRKLQK